MNQLGRTLTLVCYFALIAVLTARITLLSPHPGIPVAIMLLIQVSPLLIALRGILRGTQYTHAWMQFVALIYFMLAIDGIAAGTIPAYLAWITLVLSIGLFIGLTMYLRGKGMKAMQRPDVRDQEQ